MQVKKAVIPVGGMGTRLLPATKSQPKEMLPVGRKPVVQYVVEELCSQGINKILFVTGRKKRSIEDHFDKDPELARALTGDEDLTPEGLEFQKADVSFFYVRQGSPLGLGDAIGCAEDFIQGSPFVVALGDSIIKSRYSPKLVERLVSSHLKNKSDCTIAVREVQENELSRYGIVKAAEKADEDFQIEDIVEKPPLQQAPSRYAVSGRYVFNPTIFGAIKRTVPEIGGELEITDAIRVLLKIGGKIRGVKLREDETRYDIGNHELYFKAFIDFALEDEKYGYTIRQYLLKKLRQIK